MSWNPVFLFGKEYIYKIFTYILTIRCSGTILYIKFIYINILHIKKGDDCIYFPVSALLIEYLILTIVETQDSYGYEISQTIKLVADIKESTLYPILKKLEKAGFLTTYSQEFQGRKRKYYSITESGKEQIEYLDGEWAVYRDTIDGIVEGRIRR